MSEQEPNGAEGNAAESKSPEGNVPEKKGRHSNRMGPKPCLDDDRKAKICAIVGRGTLPIFRQQGPHPSRKAESTAALARCGPFC